MTWTRGARQLTNRPGAVAPIVAVFLVVMVGGAAMAIDVGMLLDARAEAQRAADSAALAGASALFDHRGRPEAERHTRAEDRAVEFATANSVHNTSVEADEVTVAFPEERRVAVTVTRQGIAPLFSGIFGISSLRAVATAHAIYYQGGSTGCLKPFGVPARDPYTMDNINDEVLVWQKSADGDYPLIKHMVVPNVRTSIESQECSPGYVTVGETLELQSGGASMAGQVDKGLEYLRDLDRDIQWSLTSYGHLGWDGFNRPDWRSSSRVINVVTYDPDAAVGNTRFAVTGFLTVFLNRHVNVQQGNDLLQYGIILPTRAMGGGPCTPPNCSDTTWGIRLVK